jgi:hypothetical protein
MIFVTVSEPEGREIYANGVYDQSRGQAAVTLLLDPGSHVFEAVISVGADRFVDFDGEVTDVDDLEKMVVALQPVVPRRLIEP